MPEGAVEGGNSTGHAAGKPRRTMDRACPHEAALAEPEPLGRRRAGDWGFGSEPPRVSRRVIGLSQTAIAGSCSWWS